MNRVPLMHQRNAITNEDFESAWKLDPCGFNFYAEIHTLRVFLIESYRFSLAFYRQDYVTSIAEV